MNESDCKLITEKLLGEKWTDFTQWENIIYSDESKMLIKEHHFGKISPSNRTFQDPQDFFACFNRLVELGKWIPFENMAFVEWDVTTRSPYQQFTEWLLSRTESGHMRLCVLCVEWLKEGGE
jgi:hypothetical protein